MGKSITGLVLSGGGARSAYQIGVLKAIAEIQGQPDTSPFSIITGTSAGAINACALASSNHQFATGVDKLLQIWSNFKPHHIYRTDLSCLVKNALRWGWNIIFPKEQTEKPLSLLDNTPLRTLLSNSIQLDKIQENINNKTLRAVCTTAYHYNSGDSISFFQGSPDIEPWKRFRRFGQPTHLTIGHLLASSAIPMVFPSETIEGSPYGDGAVRFLAPLSPALHLGANKLFVITVEPLRSEVNHSISTPSIGDIAGHMLDSIFIDSLESDIERLLRINELVAHIPESDIVKEQLTVKPVDAFVISPSVDPSELAGRYFNKLPASLKFFFKRVGIDDENGENILSYLLFDSSFTQHLIDLGYQDAIAQSHNIKAFLDKQLLPEILLDEDSLPVNP